jgi:hypothetical protein
MYIVEQTNQQQNIFDGQSIIPEAQETKILSEKKWRCENGIDASLPVERERASKSDAARQRERRVRLKTDPDAREKLRIADKKSYEARKARLDADPVKKERVRIARVERDRERRARIKADPVETGKELGNYAKSGTCDRVRRARIKADPVEKERAPGSPGMQKPYK